LQRFRAADTLRKTDTVDDATVNFIRKSGFTMIRWLLPGLLLLVLLARSTLAAPCGGNFGDFVAAMTQEATASGIPRAVTDNAFAGVTPDQTVLAFDHRQRNTYSQSFEEFAATRVTALRVSRGKQMLARHSALLSRVELIFGVPGPLLVAIWGLETDYGTGDMGRLPVIRTLTTLGYDCRRTEMFQGELLAALRVVQRGDLPLREMIGAYAGELGQTQFLPSSYIKYGVDFDGDGRVDLRHSVPDVLASTAHLLQVNGWHADERFDEGTANFEVLRQWNRADLYRRTLVFFARRLMEP
jgi:lytic murein transglycosylase